MIGDYSRQLSSVLIKEPNTDEEDETIYSLDKIQRKISALKQITSPQEEFLQRDEKIDPGQSDTPMLNTFESTNRHTDVTPQQLSERWGISVNTAAQTLKHTTQKFLRCAILPLSRRYRADRVFTRKTHSGD